MKVSVSLPEADVSFVDDYASRSGSASRSAVLHRAIELLRLSEMEDAYTAAWAEWEVSDDSRLWHDTAADGIGDAAR